MLVVIGTIALIWVLWQPIAWIIVATFVAVALAGPVNLLARVMPRPLAIALVYIAVLLIPIGISAAVLPPIVDQGVNFVNDLPGYVNDLQTEVQKNPKLTKFDDDFGVTTELNRIAQDAPTKIGEAATIIRDFGSGLVSSLFAGLTIYILSIFMVARGRTWIDGLLSLRSGRESKAASVALDRISNAVGNYIAGAAVQATIAGLCAFVILTILGGAVRWRAGRSLRALRLDSTGRRIHRRRDHPDRHALCRLPNRLDHLVRLCERLSEL